jgi:arsenate reductase
MEFYHNPRCRKSREALALLEERQVKVPIRLYLEESPDTEELEALLKKLGLEPEQVIRRGEAIFKEEYKGKDLDRKGWIKAIAKHPKLLERPIFVKGRKAVIGRPPERVLELL